MELLRREMRRTLSRGPTELRPAVLAADEEDAARARRIHSGIRRPNRASSRPLCASVASSFDERAEVARMAAATRPKPPDATPARSRRGQITTPAARARAVTPARGHRERTGRATVAGGRRWREWLPS